MENKELYKLEIGKVITDILVGESAKGDMDIVTEGGAVSIESYHSQGCCESVYADFSAIEYYKKEIVGKEFENLVVKSVEGMGFLLCFNNKYDESVKVFIPCYNYQNGYYGSDLELQITNNGVQVKIDISNLVEDHID